MLDFTGIPTISPSLRVGDCAYNVSRMRPLLTKARQAGAHVVLFPELGITGYSCGDLFRQPALLQAAQSEVPCLIVIDPYTIVDNYVPEISDADLTYLGNPDTEDLCFLVVAVLKENFKESVVNLKSPIVINAKTKCAKQVILENSNYPIRYKLFGNN